MQNGVQKRTIVRFTKEGVAEGLPPSIEMNCTGIAFNQIGCVLLMNGEEAIGMFPVHAVAGVYQPDGANLVQPATGLLVQ